MFPASCARAALIALMLLLAGPTFADTLSRQGGRMLVFEQTIDEHGVSTSAGREGVATINSVGNYTTADRGREIHRADTIVYIAPFPMTGVVDRNQLIGWSGYYFGFHAPTIANDLETYMKKVGVPIATYIYEHRLRLPGSSKWKRLRWSLLVDTTGRRVYGAPEIIDEDPTILEVTYIPKRVGDALPSGWAYPNAGHLMWREVDKNGTPMGPTTQIDTGGAYDEPDTLGALDQVDPNTMLECLVDRDVATAKTIVCPVVPGFTDVKRLMGSIDVAYAYVDYVRTLKPVYDEVPNPAYTATNDEPESILIPHAAVEVTMREFNKAKRAFFLAAIGTGTYVNEGNYGFEIHIVIDRFRVFPYVDITTGTVEARHQQINQYNAVGISPTQPYSKTVSTPRGTRCSDLTYEIIDPFHTTTIYDYRNDTLNGLALADYVSVASVVCK